MVQGDFGVGEHGPVDDVGEASFEGPDRFFARGALVGAAVQERACGGV